MRRMICALLCLLLAAVCCGCGQKAETDVPRPWDATGTEVQTEPDTETTRQAELSTLAQMEVDEASITLPQGIYAADIAKLETVLWRIFFFRDQDFSQATTEDALCYIADSATPWGLAHIYDTFDPDHTRGTYETMSVEDEPDPLELFPDVYYRVEESVIDFLLRDVFGVEPDTETQTDGAYYADGYWYFNSLATGMTGNETHIRACQILEDGHYRLTAELLAPRNETEMAHEASTFVEIRLPETIDDAPNDARVWQILSVETFE